MFLIANSSVCTDASMVSAFLPLRNNIVTMLLQGAAAVATANYVKMKYYMEEGN
jgi:hypothetical protein